MRVIVIFFLIALINISGFSASILIPMDNAQRDHLKAYGIAFWSLERNVQMQWLLNYRGGSFLIPYVQEIENECQVRGVSFEIIADGRTNQMLNEIASPSQNMDAVSLEKAPKIAVYTPPTSLPWDDAVTLVLTYAEIPYDKIYDAEIVGGELMNYDWLHLHHEDFTGQYGKFYRNYQHMPWYQKEVQSNEQMAQNLGFLKVSEMKLAVAKSIQRYVANGGFLFTMCAASETIDIALAAENTDICDWMYDGDPPDPNFNDKLDFSNTFAFHNFRVEEDPMKYEYSNIDATNYRSLRMDNDFFTLFEYSAKWDPVPTMLTQNHSRVVKGFMGQTTSFVKDYIKPEVVIMGENQAHNEARYIHGTFGNGTWTFYGGHDPEDYQHRVGDPPTDLYLHPNSPGYRLILNNVLFPSAKKKKQKT
jgi:hypothetical protein